VATSELEAVVRVCTVPWIVAPLVSAAGEVGEAGEVAEELQPAPPMTRAMTGSEVSTRKTAFIENSFD
jgi:hypothetical protein